MRTAGENRAMSKTGPVTATPTREQIAEELRVMLVRRRISAAELARQIGVTQPYLWRRMAGEIAFDVDDLDAIAEVLRVKIERSSRGWRLTHEYDRTRLSGRPRAARVLNPSVRRPKPLTLPGE